jgi:DNA modification methylase
LTKPSRKIASPLADLKGADQRVYVGDCCQFMKQQPSDSVDLAFADPPFNIGENYDQHNDRMISDDYLKWCREWMEQVFRLLKSDGSFWLSIGDEYVSELDVLAKRTIGFTKRSHVVWHYTFGVNCQRKFTRSHAHLLYYTKGKNFTFDEEIARVPSARQLVYNDKRAKAGGRQPDDLWILRPQWCPEGFYSDSDTWYVPRISGTFKERVGTPNQMPEPVMARIISICSKPDDVIFDPFVGSGTTLAVAKKLGRRFIGTELSADYAAKAQARIDGSKVGDALAGKSPAYDAKPPTG